VARVNTQLTHLAGQSDEARFTGKNGFFRTDHVDVDGVHHCSCKS
jgi:hypothetical protein